MILIKIGLDEVDWSAFAVEHELFEHVDDHFFLLAVELLLVLALRNVRGEELPAQLLKCCLQVQAFRRLQICRLKGLLELLWSLLTENFRWIPFPELHVIDTAELHVIYIPELIFHLLHERIRRLLDVHFVFRTRFPVFHIIIEIRFINVFVSNGVLIEMVLVLFGLEMSSS